MVRMDPAVGMAVAALALSGAQMAHAAEPAPADADIIVTARRVAENLQDVPLAVSAVGHDALKNQSVRDIADLSASLPNLNIQSANSDIQAATVTIRGQSQANVLLAIDSPVGVYVDGLNNPRSYGLRNGLVDIQRVEVLRGPQGTLYGRNTTGGAISIITQDPRDSFGVSVNGGVGNYHSWNAGAVLNVPITDDIAARFVAQRVVRGSYIDTLLSNARPNREDSYYFRGKLLGKFGALTASITGDYYNNNAGGQASHLTGLVNGTVVTSDAGNFVVLGGRTAWSVARQAGIAPATGLPTSAQLLAGSALFASYMNRPDFFSSYQTYGIASKNKGGSAVVDLTLELSDAVKLRSISGYRGFHRFTGTDYDSSPFSIHDATLDTRDDFYSEEVQLLGNSGRFDWVVGGYYSNEKGTEFTTSATLFPLAATVGITDADVSNKSYAFFGQGNWHFADKWSLTAGARWTRETKGIVNRNRNNFGCTVLPSLLDTPGICAATLSNSFSDPSWIVSVDYKPVDQVMMYLKASRGFRGGAQNYRAFGNNPAVYNAVAPETVTEYEFGVKSEMFDRRVKLNLAAFYDDYTDVQRSVLQLVGATLTTLITNAAKAHLWGIEAEGAVRPSEHFAIDGAVGYLHPKYVDFSDLSGPNGTRADRSNEPWPAPHWNFRIGAQVNYPLSFGSLLVRADYVWQSDFNLSPAAVAASQVTQPAYGLLNGRAAIKIDDHGAEIAAFARNIANTKYYTSAVSFESIGFNSMQPGEARTFGLQLSVAFGSER